MARGIELILLGMRDHHHLPGMPRIAGTTTTASCLQCGDGCLVDEDPGGEADLESCRGAPCGMTAWADREIGCLG
jgi:hypothetical protein